MFSIHNRAASGNAYVSNGFSKSNKVIVSTFPRYAAQLLHAHAFPPVPNQRHLQQQRLSACNVPLDGRQSADAPEAVMLPEVAGPEDIKLEQEWLAGMVTLWLNEEWTPLEVHDDLGKAAGRAYAKLRYSGERDLASVLLNLSSDLMSFDFKETFTDPFEVANKVSEMLMLRMGIDVCCTSEQDRTRAQRFEEMQQ